MIGQPYIDRIDDRLAALEAALKTALPTRLVEIGLVPYEDRSRDELQQGVVNIVSNGEGDYHRGKGMAAREGIHKVLLICHLQVDEAQTRAELQQAEIDLMEAIKSFVRTGVAGMTVVLDSVQQSRLLEHPYGWVVAFIELHPPHTSVY